MNLIRRNLRLLAAAGGCIALGAGVSAIATAGAATTTGSSGAPAATPQHVLGKHRDMLARAVQGQLTVATRSGFETITFDRGTVDSVSGQQLTLTEGGKDTVTRTVTLTIPSSAVVRDDRQTATLSKLTKGQRVLVISSPKRTSVVAHTPHSG